jgi:hypothetical protein
MTPLGRIRKLLKGGVTGDGEVGTDRMKVWKVKHFTKAYDGFGSVVGVKFSVTAPKTKKSSINVQRWVQIRWKGELVAPCDEKQTKRELKEAKQAQASLTSEAYEYGYLLTKHYSKLLKKEFNVYIGSKTFTGVRGEQLTALIDAVLYSTAEVVKLKK